MLQVHTAMNLRHKQKEERKEFYDALPCDVNLRIPFLSTARLLLLHQSKNLLSLLSSFRPLLSPPNTFPALS